MATEISRDNSYDILLSTESKPTTAKNKDLILEVDTGTWYVFYDGTWYAQ